jgi:hypothetical protein
MSLIIAQHLEFVERQAQFHEFRRLKLVEKVNSSAGTNGVNRAREDVVFHTRMNAAFCELLAAMQRDMQLYAEVEKSKTELIPSSLDSTKELDDLLGQATRILPAHLDNLPQELIDQLQISDADRFQWDVVDLINRTPDRTISIDVLLIALYRTTGKVHDRTDLSNRMWRLTRKGIVSAAPGKKGLYTTGNETPEFDFPPSEEEIADDIKELL